jgi:hypothetical protein
MTHIKTMRGLLLDDQGGGKRRSGIIAQIGSSAPLPLTRGASNGEYEGLGGYRVARRPDITTRQSVIRSDQGGGKRRSVILAGPLLERAPIAAGERSPPSSPYLVPTRGWASLSIRPNIHIVCRG